MTRVRRALLGGNKASFAVRDGNFENLAHVGVTHPGRLRRGNADVRNGGLVAANLVIRQRRRVLVGVYDVAKRHEAQLDERLESVANAEHEAVSVVEKVVDCFFQARIFEKRNDELGRSVGLVSSRETPGRKIICEARICCSKISADPWRAAGVRFLMR